MSGVKIIAITNIPRGPRGLPVTQVWWLLFLLVTFLGDVPS
jgi:hypothetical protein